MTYKKFDAIICDFESKTNINCLSKIGGIPIVLRSIISLKNTNNISNIYVLSNSSEVIKYCSSYNILPLFDDQNVEINYSSFLELAELISLSKKDIKELVIVNLRYPFLSCSEIEKVIQPINKGYEFCFAVRNLKKDFLNLNKNLKEKKFNSYSNDLQSTYVMNDFKLLKDPNFLIYSKTCEVDIKWTLPFHINKEDDLKLGLRLLNTINIPNSRAINSSNLKIVFLDFDGVLTDNYVLSDKYGNEVIRTSKYDSFAIGRLINEFKIDVFIITSELSDTHKKRAEKINVPIVQSKTSKDQIVRGILQKRGINYNLKNQSNPESIFIGNDINDLNVYPFVDLFCCPSDSNPIVFRDSDFVLESKGGDSVVRELVELIS